MSDHPVRYERTLPELLADLTRDTTALVREEVALARAEITGKIDHALAGVVLLVAGGVLALAAVMIVLDAIILALATFLPAWLAALIVAIGAGVAAWVLVRTGIARISPSGLGETRTAESLRRDADMVKEHLR